MSDDKSKTGQDRKEISLEEHSEVRAWCNSLGCDEAELRLAVQKSRAQRGEGPRVPVKPLAKVIASPQEPHHSCCYGQLFQPTRARGNFTAHAHR
jgi:hypothetical protein